MFSMLPGGPNLGSTHVRIFLKRKLKPGLTLMSRSTFVALLTINKETSLQDQMRLHKYILNLVKFTTNSKKLNCKKDRAK